MKLLKRTVAFALAGLLLVVVAFDIWGALTLGTITPSAQPEWHEEANKVVMVFGATGSVGDGLLKAAVEDPAVEKVYVVTRRSSERIDAGVASGKVEMLLHEDFTDYSSLAPILGEVDTVLWGLGTTSIGMDDETYTWIHVDFPVAFVTAWLDARTTGPMAFHYVTGMGTDINGEQHWAREKGRAEREVAELAVGTDLRTFGYRSAFVRPSSEQANALHYLLEALLRPGDLVISSTELGNAMLEISARTTELDNGTLIDNADSIAYAQAYEERQNR
ncbi:MAG: NmrA family NAD(P)-binding protein [Halioglobus sp.]|nr:NmrA family NAD(P)-binding protein [Halioglobus sp.]